jgi:hypothetical protein
MIVLGPMDADLNGAPPYWRTANWRPNTPPTSSTSCAFTTCPFDKCDLVFEYDARDSKRPMPDDQGWSLRGDEGGSLWQHDPERGALHYSIPDDVPSFWSFDARIERIPDRAVGYGLFLPESAKKQTRAGGLDFVTIASPREGRFRGMRGNWSGGWNYRRLDDAAVIPMVQPSAVQALSDVWHGLALDAELTGPNVAGEGVEKNDGGSTIGSLDGILNNDPRRLFGYGEQGKSAARALFGKTEAGGTIDGWIRNYVASYPGRFMRAGFRAVAFGDATLLRFVFCAEADREADADTAAFLVRYASPSLGLRASSLPAIEAPPVVGAFQAGRTVELRVELARLVVGEELWFTIERDWQNEEDRLRSALHLLMVVVQEAGR